MKRGFSDYFLLWCKGLAMGAADVVPGVSGGTIAFISGIYEELLQTIDGFKLKLFQDIKRNGFLPIWHSSNASFFLVLVFGIFTSVLTFAKIISGLLEAYPILVWSFFFGLIVASIWIIARQITLWRPLSVLTFLMGAVVSYGVTAVEPLGTTDSYWFLFIAGFLAIIAMILPGISGAFILLLLGAYEGVLQTLNNLRSGFVNGHGDLFWQSFLKIIIMVAGAIVGIKVFSGILNWMFKHHKNLTLALLTGFMVGSLNKIWPWKKVLTWHLNSQNKKVPLLEKSISPFAYEGNNQLLWAAILAGIGFLLILVLEKLAHKKH